MTGARVAVEFLGMPGAGKSTLAHALAMVLRTRGVEVDEPTFATDHLMGPTRRRLFKLRRILRDIASHPVRAGRTLALVRRSRQRRKAEIILATANWLYVRSLVERPPASTPVQLLDEGVYQALYSIAFEAEGSETPALLERLAAAAPAPSLVVVLEVGEEEVRRRLIGRRNGTSRMDGPRGQTADAWIRARRALSMASEVLRDVAARSGGLRVVVVAPRRHSDVLGIARRLAGLVLAASKQKPQAVAAEGAASTGAPARARMLPLQGP